MTLCYCPLTEEVIKVVGVVAFAVWDPDANTIDPVTTSLMAGTSLEEVTEAVGVAAPDVWAPDDANTSDPVATSLMAGTSLEEVTEAVGVAAFVVWAPDDANTSDPVTTSLMAGTSLEEVTEAVGVAAFAVCDDAKMSVETVSSAAGTSSTTGTLMVWPRYRLVASTPGLAASRDCTEIPFSCAICQKESPCWT